MKNNNKRDLLVVWRHGAYADALKEVCGEEMVSTSTEELARSLEKADGLAGLVVLTELDWDGRSLSEHYGVDLVKSLVRAKLKSRLPVLFVSFLDHEQLLLDARGKGVLQRRLVGAVGHELMPLPSTPNDWRRRLKRVSPLTELQLVDVVNNLCDLRGLISEAIHQMQGSVREEMARSGGHAGSAIRELVSTGLSEITSMIGSDAAARERDDLLREYDAEMTGGVPDAQSFLNTCGERFRSLVRDEDETAADAATPSPGLLPWRALILDDEPSWLTPIVKALRHRGVDCQVVTDEAEAERVIVEDVFNEITVVMSDYRLHDRSVGVYRQQRRQGYDFLFDMAGKDRLTALIAISGLSRKFLLESFQKYHARVEVFYKNYLLTEGAVNLFADRVLDLGNETFDALCSRPSGAVWASLLPYYVAHRLSRDRDESERAISRRARKYVLRVEEIFARGSTDLLVEPMLEELEDLQGDMKRSGTADPRMLERFRDKLVARRIAIWLSLVKHFGHVKIFAALTGRLDVPSLLEEIRDNLRGEAEKNGDNWASNLEQNANKRLDTRAKQLFNKLALKLSDLPDGLLAEERQWLKNDMRLGDIYDLTRLRNQAFYCVRVGLEKWADLNPKVVKRLKDVEGWQEQLPPPVTNWDDAATALRDVAGVLSTEDDRSAYLALLSHIRKNLPAHSHEAGPARDGKDEGAFLGCLNELEHRVGAPRGGES